MATLDELPKGKTAVIEAVSGQKILCGGIFWKWG